ncbi:hypothetical protein DZG01_19470 [Pseudomonas fluorescens]|nr:hypothetical protein DZG01_19470 [Pseudomonas fluorescens]
MGLVCPPRHSFSALPVFLYSSFDLSRAGSLPQWICGVHRTCGRHPSLVGASLLAMRLALIASGPKLYPIQSFVRQ